MGSAQARHVASRGTIGGPPIAGNPSLSALTTGPPQDVGTASSTAPEGNVDDRIPVVFTWTHGGQNVFLAASFNGWREQIPMVRSGNEFSVVQELPRGVHQYKFIVDDQWRFATDQQKTQDAHGNMNNVLDITNYHRFQAGFVDREPPPKYGQVIPDPNDYTLDAPHIPLVLHKSPFCCLPTRPIFAGTPSLSIPTHALADHIYLQERENLNVPLTMAVTHRYNQKYSTTVFASCGPFGFGTAGPGQNWLKRGTRRPPRDRER